MALTRAVRAGFKKKKKVKSKCGAEFSLLHGNCNPGDASANGRKPEPDTGIKVGGADGLK